MARKTRARRLVSVRLRDTFGISDGVDNLGWMKGLAQNEAQVRVRSKHNSGFSRERGWRDCIVN
ncbi:hypothetical protein RRF57_000067 [Xylaria bambusicola]|uniref:Uncharacterized protein n=1 Tax=Xylaria bambusicola TaxID=326684 RepID=A0AAN7Z5C5_9PEZI